MKDPIYDYFYNKAKKIISEYNIIETAPEEFREVNSYAYNVVDKDSIFKIEEALEKFSKDENSYIEYFANLWTPFKAQKVNLHESMLEEFEETIDDLNDFIDSQATMQEYIGTKPIEELIKECFQTELSFMNGLNARARFNCILIENENFIQQSDQNLKKMCLMECNRIATYYTGYTLANLIYRNQNQAFDSTRSSYN